MPWHALRLFTAVSALILFSGSCGPGMPAYLDRTRPLEADRDHPLVKELIPFLERPSERNPDVLMRTWKEFLGSRPIPLRQDSVVTFVYYDFGPNPAPVFLEASFAPGRLEPMRRIGASRLFVATYDVPRMDRVKYRYSTGTAPLIDPFQPEVGPGEDPWHPGQPAAPESARVHRVIGASEPVLDGQDLEIVLPPGYIRDLASTYPVMIVVGSGAAEAIRPVGLLMEQGLIGPVVAVAMESRANELALRETLEVRVVPWVRSRYRGSERISDLSLVGWGPAAKTVQALAAARPEVWPKVWYTLDPAFIKTQFPVVEP